MKTLEAYKRLGLVDPSRYYGGYVDPSGRIRGSGKTTRIAIEMALDIYACNDPNTKFIILGTAPECENLYSKALDFVNRLCDRNVIYLLDRRHIRTEDRLRGRSNLFVYSDPIVPTRLTPPLCFARKIIPFEGDCCRVLDRDDIMLREGRKSDFLAFVEGHNMCVDNVVTGDRIWNLRYWWKA